MQRSTATKADVCVVGAGPHGLALAARLLDAGWQVTLVDRETDRSTRRQTMLIQPGAIEVLESLGVREDIELETHRLDGYNYYLDGQEIAALRYKDVDGIRFPYGLGVPYRTLQRVLLAKLETYPGFSRFDGAVPTAILRDSYGELGGVAFTQDSGRSEQTVHCTVVVAADGEASPTRSLAGIEITPATWDYEALTVRVPRPDGWPSLMCNYRSSGNRYLGLAAYEPDVLSILWGIRSGGYDEIRARGFDAFVAQLLSVEPRMEPLLGEVRGFEDLRHNVFAGHMANRWVDDGVVLLGSSAHSLTTFGGQNMNLALYDAQSAADVVDDALRRGDTSAASLAAYEEKRRPLVESIAQFQVDVGAPSSGDGSGAPARDAMQGALQQMFRSMALGPAAFPQTRTEAPASPAAAGPSGRSRLYDFDARYGDLLNWAWERTPKAGAMPMLGEMGRYAGEHGVPVIGPLSGRLLHQLARLIGARTVFEFGSAIGYSTLWLADAVGPNGTVHYTEEDPGLAERARDYLTRAGVADRVQIHVGDAFASLAGTEGDFDLVLCDIDKRLYPRVLTEALPRVRSGGLFVADNIFWNGACLNGFAGDPMGAAIGEFLDTLLADESLFTSLLPIGDGLSVSTRA